MLVRVRVRVRVNVFIWRRIHGYIRVRARARERIHTGLPRVHGQEDFPDVKLNPKLSPDVSIQAYHGFMVKKTFQMGLMAAPGTGTSAN